MDKFFLVYIDSRDERTEGPYDSEQEAKNAIEQGRHPNDRYCVVIGPIPIEELPAVSLTVFQDPTDTAA